MRLGTCDGCAGLKRLRDDGTVPLHYLGIPVSRRAVRIVGAGRVRRRCPGSGKPPRRTEPWTPASKPLLATAVGGWTVTAVGGRVWLHHAWPAADGDLTPDAAETLAAALLRADARHCPDAP